MSRSRLFGPAVWSAFFLSGMAGLVYEVVWARYLNLILGGTAYAHVMVLAAYMGGMAGGAWFFGRRADRTAEPLLFYAGLEIVVGVYGLLFPFLFTVAGALYVLLAHPLGTTGIPGTINKLIFSLLLLGPSTFLMGGTLPMLTRAVTDAPDGVGRGVAGLYFINSSGAVLGTLLAGFGLIPAVGQAGTVRVAALVNLIVGLGLLAAWRSGILGTTRTQDPAPDASASVGPRFSELPAGDPRLASWARIATLGAGLSGAIVMVYEVAWIRLLSTILGSSTFSFTLMLAAFITGIALGSLLARRLARRGTPFLHFGIAQAAVGAALLLTIPLYADLPFWFASLQGVTARSQGGYVLYETSKYIFCLLIMLPPTLASGAALPLATDVAARLQEQIGGPVGRVYAVNTAGTIVGALVGGLVLLPVLGVRVTLEVGILAGMAFGLWVLSLHPAVPRRRLSAAAVSLLLLFVGYRLVVPTWDQRALAAGVFRFHDPTQSAASELRQVVDDLDVVFYEEDVNGTVAVLQRGGQNALVVNGKADASTFLNDRATQTLIPAIPAMMVPGATRALVIGLGSGQSAGYLLNFPVEQVEIIEISSGVVAASSWFDAISGRPLQDPRTRLIVQDAKTYLLTRPQVRYDLILSEPSNPWVAGIGGLFSLEYFQNLRSHLAEGGAVAQWIHAYEQSDETLRSVLVTFSEVFPHVSLWGMSRSDLLLVGTMDPQQWDFDRMRNLMQRPGVQQGLLDVGIPGPFTLLGLQLMGPERMAEVVSTGGRLNTDDRPFLEYQAPRAFFLDSSADLHVHYDERLRTRRHAGLALRDYLGDRDPTLEELKGLMAYLDQFGGTQPHIYGSAAAASWLRAPQDPASAEEALLGGIAAQQGQTEAAAQASAAHPADRTLLGIYAQALLDTYDRRRSVLYDAAATAARLVEVLPRAASGAPADASFYRFRLGQVLYDQGRYEDAVDVLQQVRGALGVQGDAAALRQQLMSLGVRDDGTAGLLARADGLFKDSDPRVPPARVNLILGFALEAAGRTDEAYQRYEDAFLLDPTDPEAAYRGAPAPPRQ